MKKLAAAFGVLMLVGVGVGAILAARSSSPSEGTETRSTFISLKIEFRKPSVWRSGRWKTRRRVSAVSIATFEHLSWPPRLPFGSGLHAAMASGDSQTVTSPR